jgi:hypothetical protein
MQFSLLLAHFLEVLRFVASLEEDLTVRAKTTEMKITDFSSGSYATVFRDEVCHHYLQPHSRCLDAHLLSTNVLGMRYICTILFTVP